MKKHVLLILAALMPYAGLLASSISVSGTISTNTTWTGVDTVKVTGDIYVNNGITLTIDPGIFVEFQGHYKLEVDGTLLAIGKETDTITFTAADQNTGWNRIVFDNTPSTNDSSKIVYCKLEYGKATNVGYRYGGAVYVYSFNKVKIFNCLFRNNYAEFDGGAIYCRFANISISNCFITGNYGDVQGGGIYLTGSDAEIKNCNISNNSGPSFGGGIYCADNAPLLINNLIANNSAANCGGVYLNNSNATLLNNTITGNSLRGVLCKDNADP
ncbi:MAG: right-handed parallel beta-helix repeat-containing protein, partial [Bacteroidales bacterium]|nr:right-handed parallel beta-helix repeat-containing protein [Bacteroidales bacterium]